ncbi:hypothetical protein [Planococcus sp. ISL-109]|uniref:hypothetical protein n=1 Tax=Planococcus sp. ISL-109 TaxID=2819166 RepID=UPI001BE7E181|nr:hypothetical protein [Planococcus sp. ISL-109]MBT2582915.1 hypothetical protein [Planococcus sp. ISL-109]
MDKKPLKTDFYIQHLYIYVSESERMALFSGLSFAHFLEAIDKPENLLLLKHPYEEASFNMHTHLDFATREEYGQLKRARSNRTGEFCWVDFRSEKQLNSLTAQEQAELLYLGHKKEPVKSPFFTTLQNEYAYLAGEEKELTKIYFRRMEKLEGLIANHFTQIIRKEANGQNFFRRRMKDLIPELPKEQFHKLRRDLGEGVLLSLADPEKTKNTIELHVRTVGEIGFMDEFWHDLDDTMRKPLSGRIIYDRKLKGWR